MRKSSINIQNMNYSAIEHNHRQYKPSYTIDTSDKNEYISFINDNYLIELTNKLGTYKKIDFNSIKTALQAQYKAHTGQKPQQSTQYFKEAVLNTDKHINKDHFIKLKEALKKEFNITVLDIAHHKDEGHINDNEKVINYHCHMIFINADLKTGITIKWDKAKLKKLQDITAQIMEMPRGIPGKNKRLEHKEYKHYINKISDLESQLIQLKEAYKEERQQLINSKKALKEDYITLKKEFEENNTLLSLAVDKIKMIMKNNNRQPNKDRQITRGA